MSFCSNCGSELEEGRNFCGNCGAQVNGGADMQQVPQPMQQSYAGQPVNDITFIDACKKFWKNYAIFEGRASVKEYWFAVLMNFVASLVLGLIPGAGIVYGLAAMIPGLAVAVRRLHDIGKSGWNLLFGLIPLVGPIMLIVFYCREGDASDNAYGSNPKYTAQN